MRTDNEMAARRMAEWAGSLAQFDLPDWDRLPQLDLYMDQVIIFLNRCLSPLNRDEEEDKAITASIINNYVRMKVMPPPTKKKYSRVHIAYLLMICLLKQSLSISRIQQMLPEDHGEAAAAALYTQFVEQFRSTVAFMRQLSFQDGRLMPERLDVPLPQDGIALITTSAIFAALAKSLTEYLLQEEPAQTVPAASNSEKNSG